MTANVFLFRPLALLTWVLSISVMSVSVMPFAGYAAPEFPELTGRIVDQAGLLDAGAEAQLDRVLTAHETAKTNQVVVVTLASLDGYTIEDYGYQLGRHWAIGQKDKDNGVLLIVAQSERKVRIEVGYGLEGALTDATSSNIIHTIILPQFRLGRFGPGITLGVDAILQAIAGEFEPRPVEKREDRSKWIALLILFFIVFNIIRVLGGGTRRRTARRGSRGIFVGGGGFGGSGGGFGGGGGGFGGGGASGGW